ncbi:hypothetical protein BVC80_1101g52 [Macleaya cordata]|uniref:OCEL domain-containing protein n=1 Tax=Macleaya cordata TaxID=56857 RepID=A0A200QCP1_MACCD|nr:hypothetical protein BVC80_1101g52 [Macleaya cordata]
MFGSSGKHGGRGRGGGGGGRGAKRIRSPYLPPPPHRPVGPPSAAPNRLSTGGAAVARNRHENTNPSVAPTAPDETFSLVSDDPLSYAMIIRLTPDLVDEIRRVEAQGGTAQIKFDSNANNPSGNVIDVGGKDFRFTWSHELGDLCDIYEERQSGEDGNGLLVESGCPWRKLNVQRILDESTKNHVKMRSEEAEQKLKSRKAIVLDNPSVKNQMKTLAAAAVDFNPRRMQFKSKKEPAFKKRKVEPAQVSIGGPPKSVFKSGFSSAAPAKGRLPVPSPPEQPVASTSPFGSGNLTKPPASVEAPQLLSKENTMNSGKETPSRTVHAVGHEVLGTKRGAGVTPKDLQSMLITLLLENPKGMSLKALEKAIGDTIPNCTKKIEPIIKKIATFQAPGRYFLKPGVELESFKKPSSGSGSSPDLAHDQTPLQESDLLEKVTAEEFEPQPQLSSKLEESNTIENIDIQQNSPDLFGDKKASDDSEGHASSSESGSDSDSESDSSDSGSESGSQSRSRSKSRSPAGSGSSSDSESDGSSSSKEGSDVDVDIMDDDKEEPEHKSQTHEVRLSTSPMPWRTPDDGPLQNGIDEDKPEGRVADAVNAAGDLHNDDYEINVVDVVDTVYEANTRSLEETMPFPADLNQPQDSQQMPFVRNVGNESQSMKDYPEQPESSNKMSKAKSKRGADLNYFDEKSESAKRSKTGSFTQPQTSGRIKDTFSSENPQHLSLDRPDQDPNKDHNVQITNKVGRDGNVDANSQKGYSLAMPGKSVSDAQRPGQRSGDLGTRGKAPDMERPIRYAENLPRVIEHSERSPNVPDKLDGSTLRSIHAHDKFSMGRDKHKEAHDEDGYAYDKSVGKNVREGDVGDKQSMLSDSHFRRHGEHAGKLKDVRQMADSHMGSFPKDNSKADPEISPLVNGKGKLLRREVSDLELGELREPIPAEETRGVKKQFDRNNSFKMSKNKSSASDNSDSVPTKGRTAGKTIQESRKQSPPNSIVGFSSNQESSFRKRTPEDDNEDSWMRPQQRVAQSQAQQMPRVDRTDSEVGSQLNRSADMGLKSRKNGYGDTHKKGPVSVPQQHDTKNAGQTMVPNTAKETKPQKSDAMADSNDRRKDSFWMESNNSSQKRRESSSDEDNCSYLKYEKDEPEHKGPIKDFSQYKEYVQEYCEKYGSYCSLNKNLETYRNDFNKLGRDLELAKGRDMERYYNILEQLKESYRQCGTRHKRLKKIFIVLHEELKYHGEEFNMKVDWSLGQETIGDVVIYGHPMPFFWVYVTKLLGTPESLKLVMEINAPVLAVADLHKDIFLLQHQCTVRHGYDTSWHANGTVMARSDTLMARLSTLMARLGTVDGGTVAGTVIDTLMARLDTANGTTNGTVRHGRHDVPARHGTAWSVPCQCAVPCPVICVHGTAHLTSLLVNISL